MPLDHDRANRVQEVVKSILLSRKNSFPDESWRTGNAPFHAAFFSLFTEPPGRYNSPTSKLFSNETPRRKLPIVGRGGNGDAASCGELSHPSEIECGIFDSRISFTKKMKNFANALSGGYKRRFIKPFALDVTNTQIRQILRIMHRLDQNESPNLHKENMLLLSEAALQDRRERALGFTVDNYVETDSFVEAIKLRPTIHSFDNWRETKEKLLYAKSALKLLHPQKEIRFYIGFPFDPTSDTPTGHNKERFFDYLVEFKKFFAPDEVLIGNELWNHLSGQPQTMESILEIIRATVQTFSLKKHSQILLG